jgi:hypothetical protein
VEFIRYLYMANTAKDLHQRIRENVNSRTRRNNVLAMRYIIKFTMTEVKTRTEACPGAACTSWFSVDSMSSERRAIANFKR